MKKLLSGMNRKGRGLFTMEWTEAQIAYSAAFQVHTLTDNLYDIGPFFNQRRNFFPCFRICHVSDHEKDG
jgi:hypothetical protein